MIQQSIQNGVNRKCVYLIINIPWNKLECFNTRGKGFPKQQNYGYLELVVTRIIKLIRFKSCFANMSY